MSGEGTATRLLLVSGAGGAGRTTLATALAARAAGRGRTLLVTVGRVVDAMRAHLHEQHARDAEEDRRRRPGDMRRQFHTGGDEGHPGRVDVDGVGGHGTDRDGQQGGGGWGGGAPSYDEPPF